jgi:hypothetical protein
MPKWVSVSQLRFLVELSHPSFRRTASVFFAQGAMLGGIVLGAFLLPTAAAQNIAAISNPNPSAGGSENTPVLARVANFKNEMSSPESRKLADWVMDSANNGNLPFIIVDKVSARVFVFDARGQLMGASAALLGLAVGDDSVPGIGQRKLSSIKPAERTTPAGRFVASLDRDIHGQEVLWVDYDTAVSLHPVVTGQPKERRAERLASPSPLDKRISYGCINVPVRFYEKVVSPTFTRTNGIVYVLPETRSAEQVFGSYDVQDASRKPVLPDAAQASNSAVR